jgi:hypothetical protein
VVRTCTSPAWHKRSKEVSLINEEKTGRSPWHVESCTTQEGIWNGMSSEHHCDWGRVRQDNMVLIKDDRSGFWVTKELCIIMGRGKEQRQVQRGQLGCCYHLPGCRVALACSAGGRAGTSGMCWRFSWLLNHNMVLFSCNCLYFGPFPL